MRLACLAGAFLLRTEVHGDGIVATHLCMVVPNTSYESFTLANPVQREAAVDSWGLVHACPAPGTGHEGKRESAGAPTGHDRCIARAMA